MENAEEVMQILERFTRLKQKEIPKELDDYLQYVAKTGDTVFKWTNLKYLFREKLLNVITQLIDTTPRMDEIPQYPNVDPFNYESMKSSLLERLESFNAAPFTIQRLSELLIDPRKQYNRIDKFMRALEKNILVVSTIEPGRKRTESENGDSLDSVVNGDLSLDVNVDIDMENEAIFNMEAQNRNGNGSAVSPNSENDVEKTVEPKLAADSESTANKNSTHEAPRGDDDELQPSSKKVKLDADASTEESESVTAIAVPASLEASEKPDQSEKSVEKDEKTETLNVDKSVTENGETNNKHPTDEESKKQQSTTEIENKNADGNTAVVTVIETIVEESKNETKISENVTEKQENEKKSEADVKITEEKLKPAAETDSKETKEEVDSSQAASEEAKNLEEVATAIEQADNKEADEKEKIIEKQEIEKCEKEEIPATGVEIEKSTTETITEKSDEKPKSEETTKEAKEVCVETKTDEVPIKKGNQPDAKAETVSKPTTTDEVVAVVDVAKTAKTSSDNESESKNQITSSTPIPQKTEVVIDKLTDNNATPSDLKATQISNETASAVADSDAAAVITSKVEVATETTPTKDTDAVAAAAAATIVSSTVEEPVVVKPAEPAIPKEDVPTTAEAEPAAFTPIPPTLALNDQPMEEDAVVNEVVMAESTATTLDGIEMATDAIEDGVVPKTDEPTVGMEVDDTSQQEEAMDQ